MQKDKKQKYDYQKHLSDSQNFITDRQLIRRIVRPGSITKADTVLEIDRKLFERAATRFLPISPFLSPLRSLRN